PRLLERGRRAADGAVDQLLEEHLDRGRHADGVRLRSRPLQRRQGLTMTTTTLEKQATRALERVVASQVAPVGTFTVRRALPDRPPHSVGPWVFLDHFGPFRVKPGHDGVGPHPHAGIETVTYLLSGRQQHRDSAGHTGIVSAGGAQWMTAGRGIIHAETPMPLTEEEHTLHGIQL